MNFKAGIQCVRGHWYAAALFAQLRRKMRGLDSQLDHQQIVRRMVCYDFLFDTTPALEFALFPLRAWLGYFV